VPDLATIGVLLSTLLAVPAGAGAQEPDAQEVFRAFSPGVGKVEVYSDGASAPGAVGSAFFVDAEGLLATSYHVVRDVVYEPGRYSAQVELAGLGRFEAEVIHVEASHDLALLRVGVEPPHLFAFSERPPERGSRMFSLGHPADLATSVVEGTFNGSVEHRVSPRFHFTGSVNPGMSGGPAITREGLVVGINVSTAGNQLSFLVPAAEVESLLEAYREGGKAAHGTLLERVEQQFVDLHGDFLGPLLDAPLATIPLGGFRVPSGMSEALDCSAMSVDPEDDRFGGVRHTCETSDRLLAYQRNSTQLLSMVHIQLEEIDLGSLRFHAAYTEFFQNLDQWLHEGNDQASAYACEEANVAAAVKLRITFCARRNQEMPSLHDIFVRSAVIGKPVEGVVSTLRIGAVPLPLARRFLRRYLEGFSWGR